MTHAAAATRHGALTIAVKAGLTSGGMCAVDDVLGVVDGDITIVGSDLDEVAREVLGGIVGPGTELITLVVGLVIWAFYRDKLPHWSFVIVASSMSALLMLGWRGVVALAQKRR